MDIFEEQMFATTPKPEPSTGPESESAPSPESESAQETKLPDTLTLSFIGFDGEFIEGLECRVRVVNKTQFMTTDSNGTLQTMTLNPNAEIEIAVKRFDGSYKVIDTTTVPVGETTWEYVSPKLLVETSTEAHEGAPGNAESQAPKPVEHDRGDITPPESVTPPAPTQTPTPPAPAKKKPSNKHAKHKTNAIPQKISGQTPVKKVEALKQGRDAQGHPQTTFISKVKDWWGSWRMPGFNLWSHDDFVQGGKTVSTSTKAQQNVPTVNAEEIKHVNEIIRYLTQQTDYKYGNAGTVEILTQLSKGTFKHQHGEKPAGKPANQCYKYVKIALTRTGWVNGVLVGESASTAGSELIKQGFIDVTDSLPDSRWAAPGDVSVYKWTQAVLEEERKKKKNPEYPNHGHIDVRSYDNYLTDYIPVSHHPRWSRYEIPRVYRKFYDPLPILRMKAFLRCIREFECQAEPDDSKRYTLLNCALPGTKSKRFSSFDTHPWDTVSKEQRSIYSAAGAYQIVYTTWVELLTGMNGAGEVIADNKMFSLAPNEAKFTPQLQDRMAVAKIENRQALGLVRKGELAGAIAKLRTEWTSLPGGKENAGRRTASGGLMDQAYFESLFNTYFTEEKRKVGIK
ncbi:hypothetical protein [Sulfuriferula thiophila]|uniref:hypothetical protein n=1 Tax=Sulfuriferula thiophila TaxID=1781211 RepID=UPI000F6091E1|nr:hypothetical protein [Sulfuriferula thiophila]